MIGKKLNYGDTIGVISPASPKNKEFIDKKLNDLISLGFKIKQGSHLKDSNNYLAGSDKDRAFDLMSMFEDKTVKAILCFRGGYGSIRMLPYIDLNVIYKNPKIFCGYSDITLLLNYINKMTDLITFHGPMVISNLSDEPTINSLLSTLMTNKSKLVFDLNKISSIKTYNEKTIEGKICGGNLSVICSALSTPYKIDIDDKVLFIEDVNEDDYKIDRLLTQLILSGELDKCKGFILGHFTPKEYNINKLVKDMLLSLNKPIIDGFPAGHEDPNLTLPIGANCLIDFNVNNLVITDQVVK